MLESFGKRAPRTLLCELDPGLERASAASIEAGLRSMAQLWGRKRALMPAVHAAVVAQALEGEAFARKLHLFGEDGGELAQLALPTPSMRATTLAMRMLNAQHDVDEGAIASCMSQRQLTLALLAWLVRAFDISIGSMSKTRARKLWQQTELDPDTWPERIKRIAAEYERDKYGEASS